MRISTLKYTSFTLQIIEDTVLKVEFIYKLKNLTVLNKSLQKHVISNYKNVSAGFNVKNEIDVSLKLREK